MEKLTGPEMMLSLEGLCQQGNATSTVVRRIRPHQESCLHFLSKGNKTTTTITIFIIIIIIILVLGFWGKKLKVSKSQQGT